MPERQTLWAWQSPMLSAALAAFLCLVAALSPAAAQADASTADAALEQRVMTLAEELRCLVCQNETLAASQSSLAVDLRQQIRVQLAAGATPQQVLDFMAARYGDFVLYRPPLKATTVLLWLGPFALLAFCAGWLVWQWQRRAPRVAAPLDPEQQARARRLLDDGAASP